jgi:hypothetical protein
VSRPSSPRALRGSRAWVALAVLWGTYSCATGQPQLAGVGDLAFRLQWEGAADLDLMVIEPSGHKIWYGDRRSPTGGVLDVDCNFQTTCPNPVENIFWAKGTAPAGSYRYEVSLADTHGAALPVRFTVSVLHGRRVVKTDEGLVRELGDTWGPGSSIWP